jgi:NAD(P)-dependent dehydrogenase (short-subunit alcohol dehydrogenase family)
MKEAAIMVTLQGATVLITGANGGLGREFVSQALARGARVVYATARTPVEHSDPRVRPLSLDVTDPKSIDAAARTASDTTILINNAGRPGRTPLLETSLDDIRAVYETNVFAPVALTKAFAPTLERNGGGAIVNVLSVMSWVPRPGAYNSSKSAFWGVTNSLRLELAAQHTLVLGAHLSFTETPMVADLSVPKAAPTDIVSAIYDGLEADAIEVLADEPSRRVRALLSGDLTALEPALWS